jgi:hypothetical protein
MITTTILAIVESFLATLAYAILFNVPKQYYTACGITGMAGAFVSGNVSGDNCGIGILCRNIGSSIDFQDFDGTEKMPDYDIFGFRNYSTCSGSWNILYSILPCDRSDVTGCCEGIRGSENCICHCTGNYFCCINSKRCIPDSLLESKEKAEKVEEPWEYVIK